MANTLNLYFFHHNLMADEPTPVAPSSTPTPAPVVPDSSPSPDVVPPETPEDVQKGQNIPYDRFSKWSAERNVEKARLAELEKAEADRIQAEAVKNGEHQTVIDSLKPKAERADVLEAVLKTSVDALLEQIPDDKKALVPESLSVEAKLEYINANRATLLGESPKKNVGTSSSPGTGEGEITDSTIFTAAQMADTAFYEKNKVAIRKAMQEGRIKD